MSHSSVQLRRAGRSLLAVSVLLLSLAHAVAVRGEPAHVKVLKNVMMRARDGTRLATDVYLPMGDEQVRDADTRWPALLIRTPYNKAGSASWAAFFASHGYAVAIQDVRGRFASEGTFYIYVNEGADGYDAVEWVAKQPWCNGKVGTYGSSYAAATQNALAVHRPPHLQTMFVLVGTANYIEDGAGRGGAFALLHNMAYSFRLAATGKESQSDPVVAAAMSGAYDRLADWLRLAPLKSDSPLSRAPSYATWYADWRAHPTYDEYWKQIGYNFEEHYSEYPEIPISLVGGWYDIFERGTLKNFAVLSQRAAPTKLLMGPWTHSTGITSAGDVDFGPEAAVDMRQGALRWFGQYLEGEENGLTEEPPVKYFVMDGGSTAKNKDGRLQGGGQWRTAATWPPSGAHEEKFYIHEDGTLAAAPCACREASTFQYDPRNPVPTVGGNIDSGKQLVPRGAQNQIAPANHVIAGNSLPLLARHDVLSFQTPPLEEDVEVAGPVRVELWVSSEAQDTDFTAKLVDVYPPSADYPDGYAMNLEDGIVRMRFRNSRTREELMQPGTVYPVTIDLWATANRFRKGRRIRLDVSSSNFPMYDLNPNTGEPLGRHTHIKRTLNSVYHDAERPSALVLTVCSP